MNHLYDLSVSGGESMLFKGPVGKERWFDTTAVGFGAKNPLWPTIGKGGAHAGFCLVLLLCRSTFRWTGGLATLLKKNSAFEIIGKETPISLNKECMSVEVDEEHKCYHHRPQMTGDLWHVCCEVNTGNGWWDYFLDGTARIILPLPH